MVFLVVVIHGKIIYRQLPLIVRVLQEKPLFFVPQGKPEPDADAEHVEFPTTHDLILHGCYLRTRQPRKGVILFGLEHGSSRWACVPYCDFLRDKGYDIFAFETRGQGQSLSHAGYEPMVWVTEFELADYRAALTYLKQRSDVDARGVGFFGISKGGSAGLHIACDDLFIRCCVTDGIFATNTTMVPYMQKWISTYARSHWIAGRLPMWYYRYASKLSLKQTSSERHCSFPRLEGRIDRLAPRPLLMIHGDADTYIKPAMAQVLFDRASAPKELWMVAGARHNQAFQLAGDAYKDRLLEFFDRHLAELPRVEVACG